MQEYLLNLQDLYYLKYNENDSQEELLELRKNQEENKNKEDLLQKKEENEVSLIYTFSYDRNPLYKK